MTLKSFLTKYQKQLFYENLMPIVPNAQRDKTDKISFNGEVKIHQLKELWKFIIFVHPMAKKCKN